MVLHKLSVLSNYNSSQAQVHPAVYQYFSAVAGKYVRFPPHPLVSTCFLALGLVQ